MNGTVIVGAGQAGFAVAARLRSKGYREKITLIGREVDPPYQRPPLSKKYLTGEMTRDQLYFRPLKFYQENGIDLRTASSVTGINREAKAIELDGSTLPYEFLVLATGARPRLLPAEIGGDLQGVYYVRTLADIDALKPAVSPGAKLLVVGGGYIGLETAAVAASLGLHATVIEAGQRILQRVASAETAAFLKRLHADHGAQIIEGTGLKRLIGVEHVTSAETEDQQVLDVDLVVVGIGVTPESQLAEAAGLKVENGIRVDEHGRTSDPTIFAVGDCASFPYKGNHIRLESVPHAIDQGNCVADAIMGATAPYIARPWFWSDQYDVKLQTAGLHSGYDRVIERAGSRPNSGSFWYYQGPRLLAVDAANDPASYMAGKRWIEAGQSPTPEDISDQNKSIKEIAAR